MLSGHSSIAELSTEDLRAMDMNTAALTGLKLAGYERTLPFWESQPDLKPAGSGNGKNGKNRRNRSLKPRRLRKASIEE